MALEPPTAARYLPGDVFEFVRPSPYFRLVNAGSAAAFVQRHAEAAEECAGALSQYPQLEIEPLWFSYACLRSLGVCDAAFFSGLLRDCAFRGLAWGAWLAILAPAPGMLPELVSALPRAHPRNAGLLRCAITVVEGADPEPAFATLEPVARRLCTVLRGTPLRTRAIRLTPPEELRPQLDEERERVRSAYRRGGLESAQQAARGTLVGEYALDYRAWSRLAPEARQVPNRVAAGGLTVDVQPAPTGMPTTR